MTWWEAVAVDLGPDPTTEDLPAVTPAGGPMPASRFVAFLFADIRGFTAFTADRGAEAAAAIAAKFAGLASEVVVSHGGVVVGTWGDEVLAEFASARAAMRAALALQQRCRAATLAEPDMPVGVGVGVDVGEPASEEDLRAGGALNFAARLCAAARPGEVLASRELVHLAGTVSGITCEPRRWLRLKGIEGRVSVLRLQPQARNQQAERRFRSILIDTPQRHRKRRRRALVAGLAAAAVVAGTGAYWLARPEPARPPVVPGEAIGAIDATNGRLLGTVPLRRSSEGVAVSPDGRDVWVANPSDDSVSRIDVKTRAVVQTVTKVGNGPVALVVVGEDVWVANSLSATVTQISTVTNQSIGTIGVGNGPSAIAYGFGWLWITNESDSTLSRVDPNRIRKTITVDVGTRPDGVTTGDGAVWVANREDNTVTRIEPGSMHPYHPIPVGAGPRGIVATPAGVWVTNSLESTVVRIDPHTYRETALIQVGDAPTAVAVGRDGTIWVSNAGDATLAHIDPARDRVTKRLFVGSAPHGLVLAGSTIWVAAQPYASLAHRGGTLTIANSGPNCCANIDTIDPAFSYWPPTWSALRLVYDGLVAWNRSPGARSELVPDLAISLPSITADGKTYTFRLRSGIRYSSGSAVRGSDICRSLERQFLPGALPSAARGHPAYYSAIVGAASCLRYRGPCHLDSGIHTDDAAGTIAFRLTRPDPDFLAKLTSLFAAAVPSGTPAHDAGTGAIPGTGPYMISKYLPDTGAAPGTPAARPGSLTLVRNPFFHRWSSSAQPDGYPDVIRWVPEPSPAAALDDIVDGRVDVHLRDGTAGAVALRTRYPGLLHIPSVAITKFVVLNPAVPPFNNPTARRAVAYALSADPVIARLSHDRAACRLAPRGYPGYSPGCAYRRDLAKARRLVVRSGTRGARVNLYSCRGLDIYANGAQHMKRVLTQIGYDTHLKLQKCEDFVDSEFSSRRPMNIEVDSWAPDFRAASQFYEPLLGCNEGTLTFGSCNHRIEVVADMALRAQLTDPGRAQRLWVRVYRMVDADARLIATDSPVGMVTLLSRRTGNYRPDDYYFGVPDLGQLWVK
jgi:peptide/nickel transport system substrate-binding protein